MRDNDNVDSNGGSRNGDEEGRAAIGPLNDVNVLEEESVLQQNNESSTREIQPNKAAANLRAASTTDSQNATNTSRNNDGVGTSDMRHIQPNVTAGRNQNDSEPARQVLHSSDASETRSKSNQQRFRSAFESYWETAASGAGIIQFFALYRATQPALLSSKCNNHTN